MFTLASNVSTAKKLRKNSTDTENLLWYYLRGKRFEGLKFRRQHPIGPYIVDFVCIEKSLVIECDGGQHSLQQPEDQMRDEWLTKRGYRVLRFWNHEVLEDLDVALEMISREVSSPAP